MRGFVLTSVWVGINIGQLIPNLIMLKTMPDYQPEGIRATVLFSTIMLATVSIFCFFFS
jgi:hypothetical protein